MAYPIYPSVDGTFNFPPEVRDALAKSAENKSAIETNPVVVANKNKNTAQDNRLAAIETTNTTQDGRLTNVESKNTTQDGRLTNVESKNTTQDGRLGSIETKNTEQDVQIDANTFGNMRRGNLLEAPDWDTFFDWGAWNVGTPVGSTFLALPPEARGAGVLINWESGPAYVTQVWELIDENGGGMWRRTKFGDTISPFKKIADEDEIAPLNLGNMRRGNLAVAPDWDTFFDWGAWNVGTPVGSTFTALPPEARGAGVLINWESGPAYVSQVWELIDANGGGMWRRTKFGTTISPFKKIVDEDELDEITPYTGFISGNTTGADLDTLLPSGGAQYKWWYISSNPTGIKNMPGKPWSGQVEAFTSGNRRIATQRVTYDNGSGVYTRSLFDTVGSGVFNRTSEWRQLNNQPDSGRRELLVDAARRRRGGTIGVGNKAAFAFRFDHWLTDFKAKIIPLLEEHGIPASQAIIPSLVGTSTNNMTWAELQDWCLDSGGELINHGLGDHVATNVEAEYVREIREGLTAIQAGTPRLAIEGFNPPGVAEAWGGYSSMDTYERHEVYAAQVILNNHAVVSGYIGNVYRDLDGSNPIGPAHLTIDFSSASGVKVIMDRLVKTGMGGVFMLHPNMLDQVDRMTTADLAEIIAYAAQLRDEGKVEILSQTGLHFASTGTTRRSDWVWNGDFTDGLNDWTGTGYSVATEGGRTFARSTGTASILSQELIVPDIGLGSQRELVYEVRATTGATVRAKIGTAAKNIVVPASPEWQTVRAFATIPLDYELPWLTVEVGRNAVGGAVDVANVRLQAI